MFDDLLQQTVKHILIDCAVLVQHVKDVSELIHLI